MTRTSIFISLIAILLLSLIVAYSQKLHNTSTLPSGSTSSQIDTEIRTMITEFGTELKNVSLLAPDAAAQMEIHYKKYIHPELLPEWKANPEKALGRTVSSPWPDHINIVSVQKESEHVYIVEANVIEVTNTTNPAAVYPVQLMLIDYTGSWKISRVNKGAYSELPQKVTIQGMTECLPHKDTSGPQTAECAFGILEDETGVHYATSLNQIKDGPLQFQTGVHVKAEGTLTPVEQLSSNGWQKYPIKGILSITSYTKI